MRYTIPRLQSLLWPLYEYSPNKVIFCFKKDAGKGVYYVDIYGDREAIIQRIKSQDAADNEKAKTSRWYNPGSFLMDRLTERLAYKNLPAKGIRRMAKLGYIKYDASTKSYVPLTQEERTRKYGLPGRVLYSSWSKPSVILKQDSRKKKARKESKRRYAWMYGEYEAYANKKEAEEKAKEALAVAEERRATNRRKLGYKKTLNKYKRSILKEGEDNIGSRKSRVMAAR